MDGMAAKQAINEELTEARGGIDNFEGNEKSELQGYCQGLTKAISIINNLPEDK